MWIAQDKPELVVEQMRVFTRQVPLLYLILLANSAFVSISYFNLAPRALTIYGPCLFAIVAVFRLIGWWLMRNADFTPQQAVKRLRSTIILAAILGSGFTFWGLALYPYGGPYEKAHVVFYMSITMIACVFCLMHLRAAALVLVFSVTIPFAIAFSQVDNFVMSAIAANFVIVTGAMLFVLSRNYDDFSKMVEQRHNLERANADAVRLSEENRKLAHLDSLTGLPNRRSFFAEIEKRAGRFAPPEKGFTLGLIDLDGFKSVNDLYGHAIGDALLVEASRRMKSHPFDNVFFARLGGDEFGFILESAGNVLPPATAICETLGEPYAIGEVTAKISASCGLAVFPASSETVAELLEFTDYALYQAKARMSGNAVLFSGRHRDQLRRSHQIDQALRNANLESELSLVYQPVCNRITNEISSFEALARWKSPQLGEVPPTQFVAEAERSQIINRMTGILLIQLLGDMAQWPEHVHVSFNLSARNLACAETMLKIMASIQRSGINPKRIEFEVTETALMIDFDNALRALILLRNMGAAIALDDFGTGYSSLSHVHQLPLDKIKIDRRFVSDMAVSPKARSVVETIIDLSENLRLTCVAEGVETEAQADMLAACGCRFMQGHLFGFPIAAEAVSAIVTRDRKLTG